MLSFSWVDILMVAIIAMSVYFGKKSHLLAELFKLFGIFLATFITIHYNPALTRFFSAQHIFPESFQAVMAFCSLLFLIMLIFSLLSEGWLMILKVEFEETINHWGAIILSFLRGYFLCSLIFLALLLIGNEGITQSTKHSVTSVLVKNTAVGIYKSFYYGFVRVIFPKEVINEQMIALIATDKKENK